MLAALVAEATSELLLVSYAAHDHPRSPAPSPTSRSGAGHGRPASAHPAPLCTSRSSSSTAESACSAAPTSPAGPSRQPRVRRADPGRSPPRRSTCGPCATRGSSPTPSSPAPGATGTDADAPRPSTRRGLPCAPATPLPRSPRPSAAGPDGTPGTPPARSPPRDPAPLANPTTSTGTNTSRQHPPGVQHMLTPDNHRTARRRHQQGGRRPRARQPSPTSPTPSPAPNGSTQPHPKFLPDLPPPVVRFVPVAPPPVLLRAAPADASSAHRNDVATVDASPDDEDRPLRKGLTWRGRLRRPPSSPSTRFTRPSPRHHDPLAEPHGRDRALAHQHVRQRPGGPQKRGMGNRRRTSCRPPA